MQRAIDPGPRCGRSDVDRAAARRKRDRQEHAGATDSSVEPGGKANLSVLFPVRRLSPEFWKANFWPRDRFIHRSGARPSGPDCHVRRGTLLLDEIGDLPCSRQPKLLRFLQDREYERIGEGITRKADLRMMAATSVDLEAAVKAGRFREELLYRLNVVEISSASSARTRAGYSAARRASIGVFCATESPQDSGIYGGSATSDRKIRLARQRARTAEHD